MSIEPISSVTSSASAAALLASVVSLPANPVIAAAADTPIQIQSTISQLEQDEEVPAAGQSLAKVQLDIQLLEQAQKLRAEKTAEPGLILSPGVSGVHAPFSPLLTNPAVRLDARA